MEGRRLGRVGDAHATDDAPADAADAPGVDAPPDVADEVAPGCGTAYFYEPFDDNTNGWTVDPTWSIATECA